MTNDVRLLESQRRRGWRALYAGVLLVILMCGAALWIDRLFLGNSSTVANQSAMQFLGKLNVAFALVVVAAMLGIANGWIMARTGQRNKALVWVLVVVFLAAVFTAFGAIDAYHP